MKIKLLSTSMLNDEGGMSHKDYGRALDRIDADRKVTYLKVKKAFEEAKLTGVNVELKRSRLGHLYILVDGSIYFTQNKKKHRLIVTHVEELSLYLNGNHIKSAQFDKYIDSLPRKDEQLQVMGKILANRYVTNIVNLESLAKDLKKLIKIIKMFEWTT